MLTYDIKRNDRIPIYQQIYSNIKDDIINEKIAFGEKLPSKRKLAEHLDVSVITVENAYSQLISEGYIESREKKGYFVLRVESLVRHSSAVQTVVQKPHQVISESYIDLSQSSVAQEHFPFSTWSKIVRKILSERDSELLRRQSYKGNAALRSAIADYLRQYRGIDADMDRIVIGGGTEFLYGMLGRVLGSSPVIGIENPGYSQIANIYRYNHIRCRYIDMDSKGISLQKLRESGADILHISPSHHFPSGITTPIGRRTEILNWCYEKEGRYIIEDDYDSEFRFKAKPVPSLYSIDKNHRVIYMNTFSKSVSPAIRISYMVLPEALIKKCDRTLSFLSSSVSVLEQMTMAEFINGGYFERHINRMARVYRTKRDNIISAIQKYFPKGEYSIHEKDAGLHFVLELKTDRSDEEIKADALKQGVKVKFLSEYYHDREHCDDHRVLITYTGIKEEDIQKGIKVLSLCVRKQ